MTPSDSTLQDLIDRYRLEFAPAPFVVFKPRKGQGAALQLQLRLSPEFVHTPTGSYVKKNKRQGLFLELAAEGAKVNGYPTFGWRDDSLVRMKLGIPDVTRLLTAIREVRHCGRELPEGLRSKPDQPFALSCFHKFNDANAVLGYQFEAARSALKVSRQSGQGAPAQQRSIVLDLAEELAFERYLGLALDGLLKLGLR